VTVESAHNVASVHSTDDRRRATDAILVLHQLHSCVATLSAIASPCTAHIRRCVHMWYGGVHGILSGLLAVSDLVLLPIHLASRSCGLLLLNLCLRWLSASNAIQAQDRRHAGLGHIVDKSSKGCALRQLKLWCTSMLQGASTHTGVVLACSHAYTCSDHS
jgi:hypothetical protein